MSTVDSSLTNTTHQIRIRESGSVGNNIGNIGNIGNTGNIGNICNTGNIGFVTKRRE